MKMSDILRQKGTAVITTVPDATVRELVASLVEHRIGALLVMEGEAMAGIVSERDVIRSLNSLGVDALDAEVRDLMTVDVLTCAPGDDVNAIAATMTERRIRHIPVLDGSSVAGLISIGDVVKSRIGELEHERESLEQYISG